MSGYGQDARRADSFRKPASYGHEAWEDQAAADSESGQSGDAGGTRAFSPEELDDARAQGSDDATTLLGSQRPQGRHAAAPRQGRQQRPAYPEQPGGRPSAQASPQAPRADQTLVSPIAQERIRAEVHVPDPAYPLQRRQAPAAQGSQGFRPQAAATPEAPLRRRRQARPQQPPMSQQGYGYQQAPYPQQGYQPQFQDEPRQGHGFARGVLLLVSWVLRLGALALVALVVVNCLTMGNRVAIMRVTAQVSQLLPKGLAGLYVLDSPFGGVFRGDFAIAAVVLFVLDWIVARIRRRLR